MSKISFAQSTSDGRGEGELDGGWLAAKDSGGGEGLPVEKVIEQDAVVEIGLMTEAGEEPCAGGSYETKAK